jgi:hypothetical protein
MLITMTVCYHPFDVTWLEAAETNTFDNLKF